jgi:hypothetical protein
MLMEYFVLYLLSKCFSLAQGKSAHSKQYLFLGSDIFAQFLIRQARQDIDFVSSLPLQPGHDFFSLMYA